MKLLTLHKHPSDVPDDGNGGEENQHRKHEGTDGVRYLVLRLRGKIRIRIFIVEDKAIQNCIHLKTTSLYISTNTFQATYPAPAAAGAARLSLYDK